MSPGSLAAEGETPLYSGRAVAALADDARRSAAALDSLSGTIQWTAELAVQRNASERHPNVHVARAGVESFTRAADNVPCFTQMTSATSAVGSR